MKKIAKSLIALGGSLLLFSVLQAAPVVSIQFACPTDSTPSLPLAPSSVAGAMPVSNWNATTAGPAGGTLTNLVDSTGAPVGGSITYGSSWGNSVNVTAASSQPNLKLVSGFTYGSPAVTIIDAPTRRSR